MSKKIMFSDAFGLTQAVLEGRKIMTRRVVNQKLIDFYNHKETKKQRIGRKKESYRFENGQGRVEA